MNDSNSKGGRTATPRRKSRKARIAIAAAAILGLGTAIGVVALEGPGHGGWHGWKEWRHHGHGASEVHVREHAKSFAERVLDEVDATAAQRDQIDKVLDNIRHVPEANLHFITFVTKAWPLREQHREHRQTLIAELGRPEVRREALEELRTQELAIADALSGELVDALFAVSGILDGDQRLALAERLTRHRRRH